MKESNNGQRRLPLRSQTKAFLDVPRRKRATPSCADLGRFVKARGAERVVNAQPSGVL
jgi:hypothetical protein